MIGVPTVWTLSSQNGIFVPRTLRKIVKEFTRFPFDWSTLEVTRKGPPALSLLVSRRATDRSVYPVSFTHTPVHGTTESRVHPFPVSVCSPTLLTNDPKPKTKNVSVVETVNVPISVGFSRLSRQTYDVQDGRCSSEEGTTLSEGGRDLDRPYLRWGRRTRGKVGVLSSPETYDSQREPFKKKKPDLPGGRHWTPTSSPKKSKVPCLCPFGWEFQEENGTKVRKIVSPTFAGFRGVTPETFMVFVYGFSLEPGAVPRRTPASGPPIETSLDW